MSWNFTTSGAAISRAGVNANSTIIASTATLAKWSDDAEADVNARTRRDWITNPPTANFAGILSIITSKIIAMDIINYDMGGFTSREEAQTMLDVLDNDIDKRITELRSQEIQEIII